MSHIKITLNQQNCILHTEDDATCQALLKLLPLDLTMYDLNHNEKYAHLSQRLPAKPYYPKNIHTGDVMLYGDDCLVIFYKTFQTEYPYTKIGHINDLPDLGESKIYAHFCS